jgi:hypothetical protein
MVMMLRKGVTSLRSHDRHLGEKTAYLSHFLHDDERDAGMTLPEHTTYSPSFGNPIGMEKSAADDDNDAHDDEMQRFSKGGLALS